MKFIALIGLMVLSYTTFVAASEHVTPQARLAAKAVADGGNALAQYKYGAMLYHGYGGVVDMPGALIYTQRAADHGLAEAQYDCALMLIWGLTGVKNLELGKDYLHRAAAQNFNPAIALAWRFNSAKFNNKTRRLLSQSLPQLLSSD